MRLLWLPEVLRAAGLTVYEVDGREHDGKTWRTRGSDTFGPVRGITCHHTAGSRTSTVAGEIRTLLVGSKSAPPPIAQLLLARNGDWYVVASGTCNHNKIGYGGPNEGYGNDALLGIEAQHSGGSEPWTEVQYRSYVRGVSALVRHKAPGWDVTVARVAGHKEHQPGQKTDPSFDMALFRADVAQMLAGGLEDDMPLSSGDISAVASRVWSASWGPETAGGRLLEARDEARRARLTAEATLAAVQGLDTAAVLARIEELAAEERGRDEAAARERADLLDLVRQGQDGSVDAAEVVRRIGELLTAPQG